MPRVGKQINKVASQISEEPPQEEPEDQSSLLFVPSGSTLLNLAMSDDAFGGYGSGKAINSVGDSNTGKTLKALTGLMEMSLQERFDLWRLVYDDAEHALEMPVEDMFGPELASRLEDPWGNKYGSPEFHASETINVVKNNVLRLLEQSKKDGRPVFYILDSYDACTSAEEQARQKKEEKIEKKIEELRKDGKDEEADKAKGMNRDYPRGPAVLSELLRKSKAPLRDTQSNLMIISQTRDVMDPMTFGATKRRAGGNALRFYSSHEIWLAIGKGGAITKIVNGTSYIIGYHIRCRSQRSKVNGKRRDVPLITYTEYGVDDIGANIDWLMQNKIWTGSKAKMSTKGFHPDSPVSRENLITWIEERTTREDKLKRVVQKGWDGIEEKLKLHRRRRFE